MFSKYKQEVLSLANTRSGKYLLTKLGQKLEFPVIDIGKDYFTEHIENDIHRSTFFSHTPIKDLFLPILTKMDIAKEYGQDAFLHHSDLERSNKYSTVYLTESTFNPDAHTESTSVDGSVFRRSVDEIWGTIRAGDGTGGDGDSGVAGWTFRISASTTTDQWSGLDRGIFLFDTSSLPDTAQINSATCEHYYITPPSAGDTFAQKVGLVSSSPASNTALENADFDLANWGSTRYATDIDYTTIHAALDQYHAFTLNNDGLAFISKTGITKFGTRSDDDIDNNVPTGWSSGVIDGGRINMADGVNDPKLVVTYSVPGFLTIL